MNQELKNLVFQSFDLHLSLHQDAMRTETYHWVSKRFEELKNYIDDDCYQPYSNEIVRLVGEHISWLTYHHMFSGYSPSPPYQNLYQNLLKAQQLFEFLKTFDDISGNALDEYQNHINNAKKLSFPFDYKKWLTRKAYERGQVIELGVSESMEINFYDGGKHSIYVRIGQEVTITQLFEFEYLETGGKVRVNLYEHRLNNRENVHRLNNREKVSSFEWGDFWIYTKNQNQQYFSVWVTGPSNLVIGNLNEEVGVYIQRQD